MQQRTSELRSCCGRRGGRPALPVPNNPYGLCGRKAQIEHNTAELRSCVKVEVDVLGSPSLIVLTVSVGNIWRRIIPAELRRYVKVEVAVRGLLVPDSLYCLCGRKATLEEEKNSQWTFRVSLISHQDNLWRKQDAAILGLLRQGKGLKTTLCTFRIAWTQQETRLWKATICFGEFCAPVWPSGKTLGW